MGDVSRKYFGTDGVRGRVGTAPLTADFALRLANAAARVLAPQGGTVLVGKDTRLSGYMFESALEAGFTSAGVDVLLIGPLPTPGIAYMTKKLGCAFGVVISASHNVYSDNGIKFFSGDGEKISDALEAKIEELLAEPPITRESEVLGRAARIDDQRVEYQKFCASTLSSETNLTGMKLVVDCANGAGYKVAPRTLMSLGADVFPIAVSPNGRNINDRCGATSPEFLTRVVRDFEADAGIALDGDGDRLIMVDEEGGVVDGDELLFILARAKKEEGTLTGTVVGTVMSNLGLEEALDALSIPFKRASVGDRHVLSMLRREGGNLGGETSGHLLILDKATTGDALVAALQVLSVMRTTGKTLKELRTGMKKFPQVHQTVSVKERFEPSEVPALLEKMHEVEALLGSDGRIVVRASGTEPVIRVMVEARDAERAKTYASVLADAVQAAS